MSESSEMNIYAESGLTSGMALDPNSRQGVQQNAEYIRGMIVELRRQCNGKQLALLQYFLSMAFEEADTHCTTKMSVKN